MCLARPPWRIHTVPRSGIFNHQLLVYQPQAQHRPLTLPGDDDNDVVVRQIYSGSVRRGLSHDLRHGVLCL